MARLILLFGLVSISLAGTATAATDPIARWRPHIDEASARFDIPADWIRQVIRFESGGHHLHDGQPIVSRAGAMGLMQLMPGTWREMRALHRLGADPHEPRDNILAGTAYLRAMYDRFGYPGMFAAYNAGPARLERHLETGQPLPAETRSYVSRIARARPLTRSGGLGSISKGGILAVPGAPAAKMPDQSSEAVSRSALFVALTTHH